MNTFDKAKFYYVTMNKAKPALQDDLLKLANSAILLVQDCAMLDDAGQMLPAAKQEDPQVKAILEVLGL